jgi:hypothetical protein
MVFSADQIISNLLFRKCFLFFFTSHLCLVFFEAMVIMARLIANFIIVFDYFKIIIISALPIQEFIKLALLITHFLYC